MSKLQTSILEARGFQNSPGSEKASASHLQPEFEPQPKLNKGGQ